MADARKIQSYQAIIPKIYAYQTPEIASSNGWTKIGYTENDVEKRVYQQTHTAGIHPKICWYDVARYQDGSNLYFKDHDFHTYLVTNAKIQRKKGTEWFHIGAEDSKALFDRFVLREGNKPLVNSTYELRQEQKEAVDMTKAYFENGGTDFLWNAKPRFGKTLTAYDLAVQMHCTNVLIITNRPAVSNSWADDFNKFIGWQYDYLFVSETDALSGKRGVISRAEYVKRITYGNEDKGMIAFESLQGLKGSVYFGGQYDKLKWLAGEYRDEYGKVIDGINFDLLIIDESHEGVDTTKTDFALRNIKRKHTLYLSGTPFKALADGKFSSDQIYNWSYMDEQEAKANWDSEDYNPYESMPKLTMHAYQMSNIIYDEIKKGINISDNQENEEYAFDLNEFFSTKSNGEFNHKEDVQKFLHALTTQDKYPYSTPELRDELAHTLWLLDRVASAKALIKLLREDEVFKEYNIVLAAGDGKTEEDEISEKAYKKVKDAIASSDKTITVSVGQLTVGVTIPEWSAVLMLCNLKSATAYVQAAFRAQNPCVVEKNGKLYRKQNSYVFDFDPARTLIIYDEFASSISTGESREKKIKRLLNFFPVIAEDENGTMVELDAAQVLSIPRRLKCTEVVRRGFMSNYLFQNIGAVFGSSAATRILGKLKPAKEEKRQKEENSLQDIREAAPTDENGNINVRDEIVIGRTQDLFGDKIYEVLDDAVVPVLDSLKNNVAQDSPIIEQTEILKENLRKVIEDEVVTPAAESYKPKISVRKSVSKETFSNIEKTLDNAVIEFQRKERLAQNDYKKAVEKAESEEGRKTAEIIFKENVQNAKQEYLNQVEKNVKEALQETPKKVVENLEKNKAKEKKKTQEDKVRDYLRGFSRTIPSFIMAYGDEGLTLQNFDQYTEEDVFEQVTGITVEEFRFLRDGGDTVENGEAKHFAGHLFDEVVFNDSVQEFLKKKTELADYFDETKEEDIFDYIPPQKNNQIFTPKKIVIQMVDELEKENPGCFDNPNNTFADLYMKSGLYITEIVKRLYRSEKMKELFPDKDERIKHILEKQVYGMAPTRIIYLIATNYILGFDENLKLSSTNFVQADASKAAQNGTLQELVDEKFQN